MIKNYLIIAFRSLGRQKLYSSLNILGLCVGITASTLLLLYVKSELSYESIHEKKDRLFRISTAASIQDTKLTAAQTMAPLGPALYNDYSEVVDFCRILDIGEELITKDENQFYEDDFWFADSSYFQMFSHELLQGDPKTCLVEPNSVVLSENMARKLFGDQDPLGQQINTGAEEWERTVTGIMTDPNPETHLKPNALVSYSTLPDENTTFWGNISDYLFIELSSTTNPDQFAQNLPDVYDKYVKELFSQFDASAEFILISLNDIHLTSEFDGELEPAGSLAYIYTFSAIAIFVLLIASINYMNLATAQATTRAKEVGIRKVMGSYRHQLRWQFVSESLVVSGISGIISLILVFFLIPGFNLLSGKSISQLFYLDPVVMIIFFSVIFLIGVLSGSYPAFYLSSFRPVQVLKGKLAAGGNVSLRRILVIGQFAISLVMIISTIVVYDQLNFLNSKELGFNRDQTIRIPLNGNTAMSKYPVLRTALLQNPNIESVASGWHTPGFQNLNMQAIGVETASGEMIEKVFQTIFVDQHYLPTLEIPIVKGRNFLESVGADTANAVIVNQRMVKEMGWDEPLGKKFSVIMNQNLDRREAKVVGVIRDYHVRALREEIEPLVVHLNLENGQLLVRAKSNDLTRTLGFIAATWEEIVTERPLEYTFVEQDLASQYLEDQKRGQVFALFSGLTILIACLGLFGLASYNSAMKKKEIGIRKVIGASLKDIMYLVSSDFIKLVSISMIVAFPIAYFFMNRWLDEFSYRVNISFTTFLLSALVTILITLFTVGYHSISAAFANPAYSLKEE